MSRFGREPWVDYDLYSSSIKDKVFVTWRFIFGSDNYYDINPKYIKCEVKKQIIDSASESIDKCIFTGNYINEHGEIVWELLINVNGDLCVNEEDFIESLTDLIPKYGKDIHKQILYDIIESIADGKYNGTLEFDIE